MKQNVDNVGPLAGLNVIDFGHYYAGPLAAMLLADQGANVIRIVKPGARELPEQQYSLLNRNKKLLELDLKTETGKSQALSLIKRADVVIENFRPGVMKRLGLDYACVKEGNPALIYLSLPGFASTDKTRAHIQAWEGVMASAGGVYTNASPFRQKLKYPPVYTPIPHVSSYGSMHGAVAIMAALVSRKDCGMGTVIEVPLVDASLTAFMPPPATSLHGKDNLEEKLPPPLVPLAHSPSDNQTTQLKKLSQAHQLICETPVSGTYLCSDNRRIYTNLIFDNTLFVERFLKALRMYRQVLKEGYVIAGRWETGLTNNVCDVVSMTPERKHRLKEMIATTFIINTSDAWRDILHKAGVPAAIVRTRDEWLALEPLQQSGIFVKLVNEQSELLVPGRLVDVNSCGKDTTYHCSEATPISEVDAHELFSRSQNNQGLQIEKRSLIKSDLLKGLKVLDLSNLFAGPSSCHFLADYGADVIKADPPILMFPEQIPGFPGKRSILTDVKTAPGRDVLERLIAWADVVVHNSLDDTALRLGITHDQLRAINPTIVSCQMSAYGGSHRNGWEWRPGVEPTLQAESGLMAQFGSLDQPLWHGFVAAADSIGGASLAFAALLGVYQQRSIGHSVECRASLARATNYYQLPLMIAEITHGGSFELASSPANGQFALGEHWWQRLYECLDGWIYVGAEKEQRHKLTNLLLGQNIEIDEQSFDKKLEKCFIKNEYAFWQEKLISADIGCHRVLSIQDISGKYTKSVNSNESDEVAEASTLIMRWDDHYSGRVFGGLASNYVRGGENHSYRRLAPPPRMGEHTTEILRELKYEEEDIKKLIRTNVCHEYLPVLGSERAYFFERGVSSYLINRGEK